METTVKKITDYVNSVKVHYDLPFANKLTINLYLEIVTILVLL